METTLQTLLGANRRISARSPEERLALLQDLSSALERIHSLPRDERLNALAEAQENVAEMEARARAAMAEWEDAHVWLQMMEVAMRDNGAEPEGDEVSEEIEARTNARRNQVSLAADTRDAIIAVMKRRPTYEWRPIEIRDAFVRAGRHATKSMIETTLRRMADDEQIKKTGRGRYRLWLPEEVMDEE